MQWLEAAKPSSHRMCKEACLPRTRDHARMVKRAWLLWPGNWLITSDATISKTVLPKDPAGACALAVKSTFAATNERKGVETTELAAKPTACLPSLPSIAARVGHTACEVNTVGCHFGRPVSYALFKAVDGSDAQLARRRRVASGRYSFS